jgi:hypothetical protein
LITEKIWLARLGADIHKADRKGVTPRDLAQPWIQKELDEAILGKVQESTLKYRMKS